MEFLSAAGAIATALLAVGAVGMVLIRWVILPNLQDFLHKFIVEYLDPITQELETNGGTSIKDKVYSMDSSLRELIEYQHGRNHDLIGQHTAILGWIKYFHRDDIAEMDPETAQQIEQALSERRVRDHGPPDGNERRGR